MSLDNDDESTPRAVSPAATGPAGPLFEGEVGAQYLLSLISGGEARGLPGAMVDRVEFQRASLGRALDDVVVYGHELGGAPAVLEVQVKRTIDFTKSDVVFREVVAQLAKAAARSDFDSTRYELAVAIARTSTKIERAYQEVLCWARRLSTPETFFTHIARAGLANEAMRTFVSTFRTNLQLAAMPHDDAAVWRILRRFQILVFDFENEGSICSLLARERATALLAHEDASRGADLWSTLVHTALAFEGSAGECQRMPLREALSQQHGLRWAGERRLFTARLNLAEASRNALEEIGSTVNGVRIDRTARVDQAYTALDTGRYVEIRGRPGVGKSSVLKDLVERFARESEVIVLTPDRTCSGGWFAMRSMLGCNVTAREFLSDLASDGGAVLFIDGLDRFEIPAQRATVLDLVREAAAVPGFSVVVTARIDFDADEPSWLPSATLDRLGRVAPIVIDDLSRDEIDQLRAAEAPLAALLTEGHPARAVVRNLYRLARLARSSTLEPAPRTEAEMAYQWWSSGDGPDDSGRRQRRRLLHNVAVATLTQAAPLDVSGHPSAVVEQLIRSQSLREVTLDRMTFGHDVLRDWAIGCLLFDEPERVAALPLDRPAPAGLVRGLEIAARLRAERSNDASPWIDLLQQLSTEAHGSWRRAALLALVRSESAAALLTRMSIPLFADGGSLLAELIRTTISVESQPGAPVWAKAGVDVTKLPSDFVAPSGLSWSRLIVWSLNEMQCIPPEVIPELVVLYSRSSQAMFGLDPLTPVLVEQLHSWLVEVESAVHPAHWRDRRPPFGLAMSYEQERDLEEKLRMNFLMFCRCCPELTATYLGRLSSNRPPGEIARGILKFRGTAAQAAPAAMVDLALATLLPVPDDEERLSPSADRDRHGPFGVFDIDFMTASPAQGPFFELLQHAPQEGLRLIRAVVAHAIHHHTRGRDPGENVVTIPLPDGERAFPWIQSYAWARGQDTYIVGSALMALEAWAHRRMEAGDTVPAVLADLLGPPSAPAAFLLVAVDVLLSHWPKTRDVLWAFAASPELLSMDRERYAHDSLDLRGTGTLTKYFEFGGPTKEPAGAATLQSLRQRPSRRISLDAIIGQYAIGGPSETRAQLQHHLERAVERVGAPDESTTGMSDVRFAAMNALHRIDPANWREVSLPTGQHVMQYEPPEQEAALLQRRQAEVQARSADTTLRLQLAAALEDRKQSSPALVSEAITWAKRFSAEKSSVDENDDPAWRERTRVIAAALAMRDGDAGQRDQHAGWARATLIAAVIAPEDALGVLRHELAYNVAGIAAVGLVSLLRHRPADGDLRRLLEVAARRDSAMAPVLAAEAPVITEVNPKLPTSILRIGLAAQVYARRHYEDDDAARTARQARGRDRLQGVVDLEMEWLEANGPEPAWAPFPAPRPPRKQHRLRLPPFEDDDEVSVEVAPEVREDALDEQGAAFWLRMALGLLNAQPRDRFRHLIDSYWDWTAAANGVGCADDEEAADPPSQWTHAYFAVVARSMVGLDNAGIARFALNRICQLPDERFFDAVAQFVPTVDELWINDGQLGVEAVLNIRAALAQRLGQSRGWQRLVRSDSSSIEVHIGPAIAALLMNQHSRIQPAKCYLLPAGAERIEPLMPELVELAVEAARSPFMALLFLNLIEVRVQPPHLAHVLRVATAWATVHQSDAKFWLDCNVGNRLCAWLDAAVSTAAIPVESEVGRELDVLLDCMVRTGVPTAKQLEDRITTLRSERD